MSSDGMLRIALEQRNACVGDIAGNTEKIVCATAEAREQGARLVVFPELMVTGYPPEDLLLREDFLRLVDEALSQLAVATAGIDVVVGAPVREDGVVYNSAVWFRDGRIHARYDKRCLPNYGVFDERRYFAPGATPTVVEFAGRRVGLTVCEDLWHASAGADLRGRVDLIINCSASPFHMDKAKARDRILTRRARELAAPIVYANLVGGQDELVFDGDSRVVNVAGETVCSSEWFVEERLLCDLDGDAIRAVKACPSARRPSETASIWRAIRLGLRDYLDKSGFDTAVVGVSGGIDSAVVLCLLSEILDASRIYALMLPSAYTAAMSREDARKVAETCGARYRELAIDSIFTTVLEQLGVGFQEAPTDITGQNAQSRIRGLLLMAYANKHKGLLVTTGNKSEMAVGYATLYGDMAGAFAPLKDVSKKRVYELAEYCNRDGERIPRRIIERPPSAELAPEQTDSQSLPPYDVLDEIIERFVEDDATQSATSGEAKRVQNMVYASEYKRRQSPPGPRITQKAFGKDRRYPIASRFRAV